VRVPPLFKGTLRAVPDKLFHMDLVGPARLCSAGGKWYALVIVDDYSRYAWVFFLANKGETFGFVRDLILRLKTWRS
jgi:transposase InsO family protein